MTILEQKTNISPAMINMISQQIRPNGVDNANILQTLTTIPRAMFVSMEYQALAYSDTELPIGHRQTMLSPLLETKILQSLNLTAADKVLEVGTGSGYLTALLATQSHIVYSVDKYSEFTHNVAKKLATFKINNVTLETGDAANGWAIYAPYDVIVVTGSLPILHKKFLQQLTINGRLFIVIGKAPCQEALLITRSSDTTWQQKKLFETVLPLLEDSTTIIEKFVF